MTNKKLRKKARKNKNQPNISINHENIVEDNCDIIKEKPLKQLGDLSRTPEKKTKDKLEKKIEKINLFHWVYNYFYNLKTFIYSKWITNY